MKIKTDSRKVQPGDTFVAIKGLTVDGHDYIDKAIAAGAVKIVAEHGSYDIDTLIVPNTKEWLQKYIVENYQVEINKLHIIGVTGTNGKTTTCFLVYQLLKRLGVKVAYMGTIGFYYEDEVITLPNTTPEITDVYSLLLDALAKGCTHVVMEVSSHSLLEKRVEGLQFEIGAFTNLTEDHLDYHKTMENYLQAKLLLLKQLKNDGVMIVNNDDSYSKYFLQDNSVTLGFSESDYHILEYQDTDKGTLIKFLYGDVLYSVETCLKCRYNVYNFMTSLAIIVGLGYRIDDVIRVSEYAKAPKGRCEQISVNGGLAVVDYAHTPDAVDKIISSFLENKQGKIVAIVGCGGDRDPMKRPIMGDIATRRADYVIFTSDNPRTEDPLKILDDIVAGVSKDNYEVVEDRREAINKGLDMIGKGDVLLILGKGHEDYQIIGHTKYHLDDMEEVKKYIDLHEVDNK